MTLYTTDWSISSDITPERAFRISRDTAKAWQLSWLDGRMLTRDQAIIGMELDELLSDPDRVDDRAQLSRIDDHAGRLGIVSEQAIILLHRRIVERIRNSELFDDRVLFSEG
ncbi:hypothetical protein [Nocardia sp. BMG111209]|uniref:hypothetical protein n=1 Tax=Nocardia sp. BMG111209 TaxID=1160137 RepID=UPI0003704259|nr:hypothetical protein [Nocardia sp. BMG111209]